MASSSRISYSRGARRVRQTRRAVPASTGSLEYAGKLAAPHLPQVLQQSRVESLESRKTPDLLEDGRDLFVFELERFQLLVHEITDLDDIGNSAGIAEIVQVCNLVDEQ